MKIIVLAAALLAAGPVAAKETLKYRTSVAGIPLGKVKVVVKGDEPGYSVRASFRMVPILRQIFYGDAVAKVDGTVVSGRHVPRESVFEYAERKGDRRTVIRFDEAGNPMQVEANPPLRKRSYDMTLAEAAGAIDPATAAAMLMTPRDDGCDLAFDVFEGSKRHRIALTGTEAQSGDTVTCTGRYERVAGFKKKYMTPERRSWPFTAILRQREGRWIPLKITADTKFGPASATIRQ